MPHTVALNTHFCNRTIFLDNPRFIHMMQPAGCFCMRKVMDWCGCSPFILRSSEKIKIANKVKNGALIGRKFDPRADMNVVNVLFQEDELRAEWQAPNFTRMYFWANMYHKKDIGSSDRTRKTWLTALSRSIISQGVLGALCPRSVELDEETGESVVSAFNLLIDPSDPGARDCETATCSAPSTGTRSLFGGMVVRLNLRIGVLHAVGETLVFPEESMAFEASEDVIAKSTDSFSRASNEPRL